MRDYSLYLNYKPQKENKQYVSIPKDLDWWIESGLLFLGRHIHLIVLLYLVGLVAYLIHNVNQRRLMQVSKIEVHGAVLTKDSDIDAIINAYQTQSNLSIDASHLQNSLTALPWVKSASVRKTSLNQLSISLEEHQPAYRFNQYELMDANGHLLAKKDTGRFSDLPRLVAKDDKKADAIRAFELYRTNFDYSDDLVIESFRLTDGLSWELWLKNGAVIKLGKSDLNARISRFSEAYKLGSLPDFTEVSVLDFRYHHGFAVKWRDEVTDYEKRLEHLLQVNSSF